MLCGCLDREVPRIDLTDRLALSTVVALPGVIVLGEGTAIDVVAASNGSNAFKMWDSNSNSKYYRATSISYKVVYIGNVASICLGQKGTLRTVPLYTIHVQFGGFLHASSLKVYESISAGSPCNVPGATGCAFAPTLGPAYGCGLRGSAQLVRPAENTKKNL